MNLIDAYQQQQQVEGNEFEENVVRKWSNITVNVKKRQILSMGQGSLYKTRLVGMLGPSGRYTVYIIILFHEVLILIITYIHKVGNRHF
jgi:hypothetical protein